LERVSRRRLLAASGGAVLASGLIAQGASAQADKPRRSPWDLAFDVAIDPAPGAVAGTPPPAGAYYSSGVIYAAGTLGGDGSVPSGARPIGTQRGWGWRFDPSRPGPAGQVATASLEIAGRGQIVLGGATIGGRRAILGGTGEFRGANGQADIVTLGQGRNRWILDYTQPYAGT